MFHVIPLQAREDLPRFMVTLPPGIGDVVSVGLSALDQIIKNDPDSHGKIDILCNARQAEILRYDPRINNLIIVDATLFPAAGRGTFLRGVFLSEELTPLFRFLQERHYTAVLPGLPAPAFYSKLRSPLMHPKLVELSKDLLALQSDQGIHISTITRKAVNAYFGNEMPPPEPHEGIMLFLHPGIIQSAQRLVADLRRRFAYSKDEKFLLLVAPDTSSDVTRPPYSLLAKGIESALIQEPRLAVCILPGYTSVQATPRLFNALSSCFPDRVEKLSPDDVPTLLATTALIDQAEIFMSGDTGVMHLAVATKMLSEPAKVSPKNMVKIITLFGGTHPGLYGYSSRAIILGRDRKEQKMFSPGVAKEFYFPTGKNLFNHITPQQVTDAILQAIHHLKSENN